jgi:hypothetical protein
MPTFQGNPFSNFYKRILQINQSSNTGVDTTVRNVESGDGAKTCLNISDDEMAIQPQNDEGTRIFKVSSASGTELLKVDSTNSLVKALEHNVNTQYATFGINATDSASLTANNHYAIPYQVNSYSDASNMPTFGTGTDPATTFTTADSNAQRASDIVPLLWRVPDNITIDEIKHFEGADAATGDTTRMHLMSYTFTSGSTSALSSGAVIANTSADNTNAGSEQAYLKDWTINTANVDAGKVLLCMFRSDSVNSDFAISVNIKYHIRG